MAKVTGTVVQIQMHPDPGGLLGIFAKVVVTDQATQKQEPFILWAQSVNQFTPPSQWITRVSTLSVLRDAYVNKLPVTITTTGATVATSAIISEVDV
jgi:hypothetical protein